MSPPIEVLLVEDDPGDLLMTQEAFQESAIAAQLHIVRDGVEAMDFVRRQDPFGEAPEPDLVLLDLNLPRMDGYEVLAAIRADQALTHLPVVVLTTSTADEDVMASYRLHASAFMSKPSDYHTYVGALRSLDHFYNDVATLPSRTT